MSDANGPAEVEIPDGLGERGAAFLAHVRATYELSDVEAELAVEVARTLDTVDELDVMARDAVTVDERLRVAREARQQRIALGRLLGQLSLPDVDGSTVPTPMQARGRRAAEARWADRAREVG